MNEQPNQIEVDVIKDLSLDLERNENETNQNAPGPSTPVVVGDFIPRELVRLAVVGKNGLAVSAIGKNLSDSAKVLVKDAYEPKDREIDLYRSAIQNHIRTNHPHLVEWFQRNTSTPLAELLVFESVRIGMLAPVIKEGMREKQKQKLKESEK